MYDRAVQLTVVNGWIIHIDGTPWCQQPLPRRWHRCEPSTTARLGIMYPEMYQRCACGGWRIRHFGGPDFGRWHDRNARRTGTSHSFTLF